MFVAKPLFTNFTVVKVLANTALVSNSNNWVNSTSIASDSAMSVKLTINLRFWNRLSKFLAFHQRFKNLRSNLIKLFVNETLESLSGRKTSLLRAASWLGSSELFFFFLRYLSITWWAVNLIIEDLWLTKSFSSFSLSLSSKSIKLWWELLFLCSLSFLLGNLLLLLFFLL